jgi:hypothetical protein
MRWRLCIVLLLLLLLTGSGCSSVPFRETRLVPTRPLTTLELIRGSWISAPVKLLVRQSVLFEFQGSRVPMAGVMRLDLPGKTARVAGLNDMGLKLFDLTVEREGFQAHFLAPELRQYPRFAEVVAESVRRIFLSPLPQGGEERRTTAETYRLTAGRGDGRVDYLFGGSGPELLEKSVSAAGERWRVHFYEYGLRAGMVFPGGAVLEDDTAGYRLTLWVESVEQSDE